MAFQQVEKWGKWETIHAPSNPPAPMRRPPKTGCSPSSKRANQNPNKNLRATMATVGEGVERSRAEHIHLLQHLGAQERVQVLPPRTWALGGGVVVLHRSKEEKQPRSWIRERKGFVRKPRKGGLRWWADAVAVWAHGYLYRLATGFGLHTGGRAAHRIGLCGRISTNSSRTRTLFAFALHTRKYYRSRALLGFILSHKHFFAARPARFLYFIRRPNFRPSSRFHFPCRSSSSRIEFRGVGGSDLFCNAFKDSPATPTVGGRFFSCSASSASPARRICWWF